MKNKKILIGSIIIVAAIIYLGVTGIEQDMSYYITAEELLDKGDEVYDTRLRVAGQVVWGSIDRSKKPMTFNIDHNNSVVTCHCFWPFCYEYHTRRFPGAPMKR